MFLKNSQNSQENTCVRISFLINLSASAFNFIKNETLAKLFSCKLYEIFKNTFFYRIPLLAASTVCIYKTNTCIFCLTLFLNYTLLDKLIANSIAYVLSLIADFIFRGDVDLRLIVNLFVRLVKISKFQAKVLHNNSSSDYTSN